MDVCGIEESETKIRIFKDLFHSNIHKNVESYMFLRLNILCKGFLVYFYTNENV